MSKLWTLCFAVLVVGVGGCNQADCRLSNQEFGQRIESCTEFIEKNPSDKSPLHGAYYNRCDAYLGKRAFIAAGIAALDKNELDQAPADFLRRLAAPIQNTHAVMLELALAHPADG